MVPDTEVLTKAKLLCIYTMLQKAQVRWAGHIVRMPDKCRPKQLLLVWPERAKSIELWPQTQITHVLSVADSSKPRLVFSAISTHTRLEMKLLKTEAVVIIACD
jgi:hypothetical protein